MDVVRDPNQELAAQYLLARRDYPDADIKQVVDVILERWGREGALTLASEALMYERPGQPTAVAARAHVRQFVYAMEQNEDMEEDEEGTGLEGPPA